MYRRADKEEVVIAMDAATGKTIWEYAYDEPLTKDFDRFNAATGPRATPLIVGDRLFTVGAAGKMFCFERKTGKVIWKRDIPASMSGQIRANGYSASPIPWKDTVIVTPWAKDGAIAALRQSTGEVVWKKHSFTVSYATPLLLKIGGRDQLVLQFSDEVTGLNP